MIIELVGPYVPMLSLVMPLFVGIFLWVLNRRMGEIHTIINSRLTQLLAANSRADKAEGTMIGAANAAEIQKMIDAAIAKAIMTPPPVGVSDQIVNELAESSRVTAHQVSKKMLESANTEKTVHANEKRITELERVSKETSV